MACAVCALNSLATLGQLRSPVHRSMAETFRMPAALAILLALLVQAAVASSDSASAHVYLYPAATGRGRAVNVSPVQINHILAHALDVPGEDVGVGASDREAWDWLEPQKGGKASVQALFGDASQKSVILLTDVDEEDVQDIFPSTMRNTHRIPAPPHAASFEALLHSYGERIYSALPAMSHPFAGFFAATVEGVEAALEGTSEWLLGGSLAPVGSLAQKVDDLHLMGEASSIFQHSVKDLIAFLHAGKDISESSSSTSTDPFRVVRFDGMGQIKATYGQDSQEFQQAKQLLRSLLEASVSKIDELTKETAQRLAVLALPKQDQHLAPRSIDLLSPFRSSVSSTPFLTTRDVVDSLKKNSSSAPKESDFIGKCFTSESDLDKATANCSSHGSATQSSKGGRKCYRCKCEQSKGQGGRVVTWAGAACQKQDLSQPFVLLLSTTVGLMFVILGSVLYLFYEGQKELPSVLAGISIPNK